MSSILKVNIETGITESISDNITATQLMIDAGPAQKNLHPGSQILVKLTVSNYSSQGRMARIRATFDGTKIGVEIPINDIYVAPQGSTAVYVVIRSYAYIGILPVEFHLVMN